MTSWRECQPPTTARSRVSLAGLVDAQVERPREAKGPAVARPQASDACSLRLSFETTSVWL